MNELLIYRTLNSLLAVARLAAECRQAVNLVARATGGAEATPYTVDELDSAAVDCLAALAEAMRNLERTSVPVTRARKRGLLGPSSVVAPRAASEDVSRETWPAPFADEDVSPGEREGGP